MKNIIMKGLAFGLALFTVLPLFTSCGNDDTAADDTAAQTDAAEITEATETLPHELTPPDFADAEFGYDFGILVRDIVGTGYVEEMEAEQETGDVFNDALYARNLAVSEKFKITFDISRIKNNDFVNAVQTSVLAGDNAYDLVLSNATQAYQLASAGATFEMNDLPHVDYSKAWWSSELLEDSSIAGRDHFAGSDMNIQIYNSLQVFIFNKGLAENYGLSDLYSTVIDGKWTYDRMIEAAKKVSGDVNGDGQMDEKDMYGMSNVSSSAVIIPYGSGLFLIEKDANDLPSVKFGEKFISFFTRVVNDMADESFSLYADRPEFTSQRMTLAGDLFFDDRLLMFRTDLGAAAQYRDRETDYGFLPVPKYDDSQTDYISVVHPQIMSVCVVPITNDRTDETGMILEQLAYESYKTVRPTYIETVMKQKYARDEESIAVLDIILDNYGLDLAFALEGLSIVTDLRALMNSFDTNVASMVDKNLPLYEAKLDETVSELTK